MAIEAQEEELKLEEEEEEELELELEEEEEEELELELEEDEEEELELELEEDEEEELELLRSAKNQRPLNSLTLLIDAKLPPSVTTRISVPTNNLNRSAFVRLEFLPNIERSIYSRPQQRPFLIQKSCCDHRHHDV